MPSAVSKITVTIPRELTEMLDEKVRQMGVTRSRLVSEAIEQYLKELRKKAIAEEMRRGYMEMSEEERKFHIRISEEGIPAENEALRIAVGDEEEEPWW